MEKSRRSRSKAESASATRRSGSRARRLMAFESDSHSPGGTSTPSIAVANEFGDAGEAVATIASCWPAASISTLGRPSWSPAAAFLPAARTDRRRAAARCIRAAPSRQETRRDRRSPHAARPAPSGVRRSPPPICSKRQCRSGGSGRSACRRSPKPFFSTSRPTERMTTGSAGSEPSRIGRAPGGGGKARRSRP